jgi:hypothetical protein
LLTQEGSVRLSPRIRRQDKIRRVNVKREPQYNIESSTARIQTSFPSSSPLPAPLTLERLPHFPLELAVIA